MVVGRFGGMYMQLFKKKLTFFYIKYLDICKKKYYLCKVNKKWNHF